MPQRFQRVADAPWFRRIAGLLGLSGQAHDDFAALLRHKTRYATCGAAWGMADAEPDPAHPGEQQIELALSRRAHHSFLADMIVAHELFHLLRHFRGWTPFPTTRYGSLRRWYEELVVWAYTFAACPVFASLLFVVVGVAGGILFLLFRLFGTWLVNS